MISKRSDLTSDFRVRTYVSFKYRTLCVKNSKKERLVVIYGVKKSMNFSLVLASFNDNETEKVGN